jgi:hypothetical protein
LFPKILGDAGAVPITLLATGQTTQDSKLNKVVGHYEDIYEPFHNLRFCGVALYVLRIKHVQKDDQNYQSQ